MNKWMEIGCLHFVCSCVFECGRSLRLNNDYYFVCRFLWIRAVNCSFVVCNVTINLELYESQLRASLSLTHSHGFAMNFSAVGIVGCNIFSTIEIPRKRISQKSTFRVPIWSDHFRLDVESKYVSAINFFMWANVNSHECVWLAKFIIKGLLK